MVEPGPVGKPGAAVLPDLAERAGSQVAEWDVCPNRQAPRLRPVDSTQGKPGRELVSSPYPGVGR